MPEEAKSSPVLNVPNLLTAVRLAALPVVIGLSRSGRHVAAGVLFAVVMISDCFDGWLARRLNQCTKLGLYLDPVVDKIVILALFYELARVGTIPTLVAHLFLARELLQNGVRAAAATGGSVVGSNWMGKTKATLQTILITWGLLMPALAVGFPEAGFRLVQTLHSVGLWTLLCLTWGFLAAFVWWNRSTIAG